MEKARVVGKDHFLTVWGGGGVLVGFKGGMPKKMVWGGQTKKYLV